MAEILVAFQRFAATVKLGHPDHVMLGPLKALHGTEKHTLKDWQALLTKLRTQPVTR